MVDLVGSTFRFRDVGGAPVDDAAPGAGPELTFELDGQVYGTGGVNRLRGTWTLEPAPGGDVLTFGPVATTLMAGTETHMVRERAVLDLLGQPLRVDLDGDELVLRAPDGAQSHLDRVTGGPTRLR